MTRPRWMALFFALGSTCFLVGPLPGYVQLVGEQVDAMTFFVGSILFTAGGALQSWLAWDEWRSAEAGGRAAWWSAIVQSAGTLFFNATTYQAMHVALTSSDYDRLVWRPDWRGSICFLVSGAIAYGASPRRGWRGWLPARGSEGWWQPAVNLLGCIFFGISAVAGYVVPVDRLDARPRRGQLEHIAGRGVLSRLRARHAAHRSSLEAAARAGSCASSSTSSSEMSSV